MSTSVTFNGASYTIPAIADASWGTNVSSYLVAISTGSFQKTGGTFTLTAEANFGATYGLKACYLKSYSTNPASAGAVRLANTDLIKWRNNANSADLGLGASTSDWIQWGGVDLLDKTTVQTGITNKTFTSPTFVTPALGTPASGVLTNCSGLPVGSGISGLGTGVATFLATPSSANLLAAVTDETGTGALVFATSPALVTPALGTPASGVLTSCTGLPLTTGVTGTLPIGNGGTGQTTAAAAFKALAAYSAKGQVVGYDGAAAGVLAVGVDGTVLTADTASTYGFKWSAALTATLADGKIFVGNVSNVATAVTPTGDVTMTNAGVTAIGAAKVTNAMLAGSIAYSKLSLSGAILNADLAGSIQGSKIIAASSSVTGTVSHESTGSGTITDATSFTASKSLTYNYSRVGTSVTFEFTNAGVAGVKSGAGTASFTSLPAGVTPSSNVVASPFTLFDGTNYKAAKVTITSGGGVVFALDASGANLANSTTYTFYPQTITWRIA